MGQQPGCRIILVRHGETEANVNGRFAESDEIPLTETGRLQAEEVARRLAREFQPTLLISSSFLRARQTSEIIGRAVGLQPVVMDGVHERDFGNLKGHVYARMGEAMLLNELPEPERTRLWKPVDGESLEDVRVRAMAALESLRLRYPGQQIVLVCHGAVIRSICSHITGEWNDTYIIPNCVPVTIEYTESGWGAPLQSDYSER